MKVKSENEVAQSCPTLSDPMDCSPPGSSIHWIFQARVLEWAAIAFSILAGLVVENLPASMGDTGSIPSLGRSHMPQSSNGDTDIENRLMDKGGGEGGEGEMNAE